MKLNTLLLSMSCAALTLPLFAQNTRMETFCNPLNVDYTYMIYNSDKDISYRSGADPAVVEFRGEQFLPIRADARYCSNACRQKDYRKRKVTAHASL